MKRAWLGCLLGLVAVPLFLTLESGGKTVSLDVEFKLTDQEYRPLPGVAVRLVPGTKDWKDPDAGVRFVTAQDGTARFSTQAAIDRRWSFTNIGFTAFSMPLRADHIAVALELPFVTPRKQSADVTHHWLYTADIDRLPDGDCATEDLDKVYEAGPDGAFNKLVGRNAAGPNFDGLVDGWKVSSAGYKLWEFMLQPSASAPSETWHLKLGLMQKPKPTIAE